MSPRSRRRDRRQSRPRAPRCRATGAGMRARRRIPWNSRDRCADCGTDCPGRRRAEKLYSGDSFPARCSRGASSASRPCRRPRPLAWAADRHTLRWSSKSGCERRPCRAPADRTNRPFGAACPGAACVGGLDPAKSFCPYVMLPRRQEMPLYRPRQVKRPRTEILLIAPTEVTKSSRNERKFRRTGALRTHLAARPGLLRKFDRVIDSRVGGGQCVPLLGRRPSLFVIPSTSRVGNELNVFLATSADPLDRSARTAVHARGQQSNTRYGFRPGRRAHDAVRRARTYVQEGRRYVVDLDLEKFFDRVNHDVLMGRLSMRIEHRRVLGLVRRYLNAGILANGVVVERHEGTPQGGPLRIVRLLVKEVLVADDAITIRHSIPVTANSPRNDEPPISSKFGATKHQGYLLRSGRTIANLGERALGRDR